jgi:hypothetical protein
MAPAAPQGTTLQEHGLPQARPIVHRALFDIKYNARRYMPHLARFMSLHKSILPRGQKSCQVQKYWGASS